MEVRFGKNVFFFNLPGIEESYSAFLSTFVIKLWDRNDGTEITWDRNGGTEMAGSVSSTHYLKYIECINGIV